jgi:hypothetical protein
MDICFREGQLREINSRVQIGRFRPVISAAKGTQQFWPRNRVLSFAFWVRDRQGCLTRARLRSGSSEPSVLVVQPGGSNRDAEVISACDEYDAAMVLTGIRLFRH